MNSPQRADWSRIAVVPATAHADASAAAIASKLNLPLAQADVPQDPFELLLRVEPDGLALVPTDRRLGGGISIDFLRGATAYRRKTAGSTKQLLARALGLRHGKADVIDATAGLGRDCLQIATLGCRVRAIERSDVLAAMLVDAIQRARTWADTTLQQALDRIRVISADAQVYLPQLKQDERPDVVYLDPMYTPRNASALSKKEMRILRLLVGGDEDAQELLRIARETARERVVVKRHLRAPPLTAGIDRSYPGRTVRYDVYQPV